MTLKEKLNKAERQELEKLMEQKREIEHKIRELKAECLIKTPFARLETKRDVLRKVVWQVSVLESYQKYKWNSENCKYDDLGIRERWIPVIRLYTKEETTKKLSELIRNLQTLRWQIAMETGKENNEQNEDEEEEIKDFTEEELEELRADDLDLT